MSKERVTIKIVGEDVPSVERIDNWLNCRFRHGYRVTEISRNPVKPGKTEMQEVFEYRASLLRDEINVIDSFPEIKAVLICMCEAVEAEIAKMEAERNG